MMLNNCQKNPSKSVSLKVNIDPKQTEHSFRPTKKLGQNFLTDRSIVARILDSAELGPEDEVIEIGPGKGALTGAIAAKVKKISAIEKDNYLYGELKNKYAELKNLTLVNEDALKTDFCNFMHGSKLKFIANLPYNITSPVLAKLTSERDIFSSIIIMIQKEVGDRIASPPGSKTYGSLSVMVQTYFDVFHLFIVPPRAFRPKPKVDSVVIKLVPTQQYYCNIKDEGIYTKVVKSSFSSRRKMISNSLRNEFERNEIEICLMNAGINGKRRAETLEVIDFIQLANNFYELQHSTSSISRSF